MTSNSLTQNKEHDIPSQIVKTILDCVHQLFFLAPNMCGIWYICMLASSQTLVDNWQNKLFISFH